MDTVKIREHDITPCTQPQYFTATESYLPGHKGAYPDDGQDNQGYASTQNRVAWTHVLGQKLCKMQFLRKST